MIALLRALPLWVWLLAAAGGALVLQTARLAAARHELMAEKAESSLQRAQYAEAAASASQAYRAEEQRRTQAQQEISHVAQLAHVRVATDRRIADAADDRLQQRVEALAAASCGAAAGNTVAAPGSPPASSPADLLADMSRRLGQAERELADFAESAAIAGSACERDYDALTPPR